VSPHGANGTRELCSWRSTVFSRAAPVLQVTRRLRCGLSDCHRSVAAAAGWCRMRRVEATQGRNEAVYYRCAVTNTVRGLGSHSIIEPVSRHRKRAIPTAPHVVQRVHYVSFERLLCAVLFDACDQCRSRARSALSRPDARVNPATRHF
jgi:hypothetical protein